MPHTLHPQDKRQNVPSFHELWQPAEAVFIDMPPLEARGNKPLQLNFEHQLKSLVFYHLEEHTSGRHLLQVLDEDDFAREVIAPPKGIKKSRFFEAINSRDLEQLTYVFQQLRAKAAKILPQEHAELGNLVAINDSLIDAVLSMHWADYRNDCKKAKVHLGFDINQSHQNSFSLRAKLMNAPLLARYSGLDKPESWTDTTSLLKKSQPSISSDGTLKYSSAGGNAISKSITLLQEPNADSWRRYWEGSSHISFLRSIVTNITKKRSALKGFERCVSKFKTKPAISKMTK